VMSSVRASARAVVEPSVRTTFTLVVALRGAYNGNVEVVGAKEPREGEVQRHVHLDGARCPDASEVKDRRLGPA
jgi:hypothetical protein